jgi:hypothetical protein
MTVLSMLLLLILTIMGIGVLTSTGSDIQTNQNESTYRQNFTRAEAAVRQAAQEINNAPADDIKNHVQAWNHKDHLPYGDPIAAGNWTAAESGQSLDPNCRYSVIHHGIMYKASLSMTAVKLHTFTIYGRSVDQDRQGEVILEVGFKRRM